MTALHLLPVVNGQAPSRTVSDRLELLQALIAAPTFDPLFRSDVILFPGDHPTYGWICRVAACRRPSETARDFCNAHRIEWKAIKGQGGTITDFYRVAKPLQPRGYVAQVPCLVCPEVPAWSSLQLCFLHYGQWNSRRQLAKANGQAEPDFDEWVSQARPFPGFGKCLVVSCAETAGHPLGLCQRHKNRYRRDGKPGGALLSHNRGYREAKLSGDLTVTYEDEARFRRWCMEMIPPRRTNGVVSLLGLPPLVKAELQWTMFHHMKGPEEAAVWPVTWLQRVADSCREQKANSLVDLDLDKCTLHARQISKAMLNYLRLIYFTREDTKDAGFLETDHFGVRFPYTHSHIDLSQISQRWLRDLLWDNMAEELTTNPPRTRGPFDQRRRGCIELSAFLEAHAPDGGHDPTLLTASHMVDFIADQRHRAQHGLQSLGLRQVGRKLTTAVVTQGVVCDVFNGARRLLRDSMESGTAQVAGVDRAFIVALPRGRKTAGRRHPFPDDVARALASEKNLHKLDALDSEDRGLRDIWEALVVTGRRCNEVLKVHLDCVTRLNDIPMFWHDQTKVGNFDEGIRISERLYVIILKRQAKTINRFVQRTGREPTESERSELALFPRGQSNRNGYKGVSYGWFSTLFRQWISELDIGQWVAHQARHTLATNLLRNGANLSHVKRYLGQISEAMAEHYVHIANTDPRMNSALEAVWVGGPGSPEPGVLLSGSEPMTREEAEALVLDLTRMSTPAEGGFCTFQPVVNGEACPWDLNCHSCDRFVVSGADLVYWRRKREQWRTIAEGARDSKTADYLHQLFEPTARAIDGLERALDALGLLDEALALDLRRPQDYFGRVWSTAFRAQELARKEDQGGDEAA